MTNAWEEEEHQKQAAREGPGLGPGEQAVPKPRALVAADSWWAEVLANEGLRCDPFSLLPLFHGVSAQCQTLLGPTQEPK